MVTYTDVSLYKELLQHPGLKLDENHPVVKLQRYAKDGKSVFKLNERDAIQLYRYHQDRWSADIQDEFGETVYDIKKILGSSYCEKNLNLTIKELFDAQEVEKELLKKLAEEE